jgi:hypothetical protein
MRFLPISMIVLILLFSLGFVVADSYLDYSYVYEMASKNIPIYAEEVVHFEESCVHYKENSTIYCVPAYDVVYDVIVGYKSVSVPKDIIGVVVLGVFYRGYVHLDGSILSEWNFPIGDRDFEKFGRCRPYEIDKGVCTEKNILEVFK